MGQHVSRNDFEWTYSDEPHATRRKEILKKHPEIKRLMHHDPRFKWIVAVLVIVQMLMCWMLSSASWYTCLVLGYCFGGVINHALMLAVHETAHNQAFGQTCGLPNRLFGLFANLPIGIPMSISFRKYHLEHHRYQGDERLDTDIPTDLEAKLFCRTFSKAIWVCFQSCFYAIRPLVVYPKKPSNLEYLNACVQIIFDLIIYHCCGPTVLFVYIILGSLLAMGPHPVAGHFISEHYMFLKGHETYSYYGPLNYVTFNVGYHMEHHDFPSVPFSKLPEVRKIAPEYYDTLPYHTSWVKVIWDFITDPEVGPYARVKRRHVEKFSSPSANGAVNEDEHQVNDDITFALKHGN
ncbi:sphingolipid delta(4)-desaturase/C4-monooxygenase DES2-like isoform X1 [Varroa destructor]|uniref:sphingolipid 4-desaturase n=1 Tax=Varroa destructor TaxID=109461 RepID=A0A7M7JLS9_VARDE|nr:sphingolipid delta(4)-desaturase/C4-monooxygenase DES2-like isoform X1 [Varroa destructor]